MRWEYGWWGDGAVGRWGDGVAYRRGGGMAYRWGGGVVPKVPRHFVVTGRLDVDHAEVPEGDRARYLNSLRFLWGVR